MTGSLAVEGEAMVRRRVTVEERSGMDLMMTVFFFFFGFWKTSVDILMLWEELVTAYRCCLLLMN